MLLCDDRTGNANTILDHIDAFRRYSRHDVKTFNPWGMSRSRALDLDAFDVVVIHYSLVLSSERYISADFRRKLARFSGLKVQFMQDEYRWVDRATAASREVGVNILYTAAAEPAAGQLYDVRLPGVRRIHTLTGYVPESLERRPRRPLRDRLLDVGYRGRDLPFWLGRLTQEKQWIAQGFRERAPYYGLRTDIAWLERDRIYGDGWIDFIASCRATLGSESGASIADFDGAVERAVRKYVRQHPDAGYAEVHDAVLKPYEGNVVVNVISPRVFEAAALGTGLVMFPGEYSGIPVAGQHFIVLEKDFSNMAEVAAKVQDAEFMSALTARTFDDLISSGRWSYRTFISEFDDVVAENARGRRQESGAARYRLAVLERTLRVPPIHVRATGAALSAAAAVRGKDFARRSEIESGTWVTKGWLAMRATITDRELLPVLRAGRKAGFPIDALLEEILDLFLLKHAALGNLSADEEFTVAPVFDRSDGSLRFVSFRTDQPMRDRASLLLQARNALGSGSVQTVEWDHTAVGESIRLVRPNVEIGIGSSGVKRYVKLMQIGKRDRRLVEAVLSPLLSLPL